MFVNHLKKDIFFNKSKKLILCRKMHFFTFFFFIFFQKKCIRKKATEKTRMFIFHHKKSLSQKISLTKMLPHRFSEYVVQFVFGYVEISWRKSIFSIFLSVCVSPTSHILIKILATFWSYNSRIWSFFKTLLETWCIIGCLRLLIAKLWVSNSKNWKGYRYLKILLRQKVHFSHWKNAKKGQKVRKWYFFVSKRAEKAIVLKSKSFEIS